MIDDRVNCLACIEVSVSDPRRIVPGCMKGLTGIIHGKAYWKGHVPKTLCDFEPGGGVTYLPPPDRPEHGWIPA